MYKFIILLTIFSVGFGVFYQQDYQGYHKITGAITQQQIERRLFCRPQGFVYVLGLGGNRVAFCVDEGWHRVVYAKEGGDWVKVWGNYSSGNDGFKCPVGVCSDYYRNIYVADAGNGRIVKLVYNPDIEELQYATEFPIGGSGSVWDIDFYDYKFYVTDPLNHHIYKLDSSGTILVTYGIKGRGIGQFWGPKGIAVFGGNVYIADEWNKRVVWLTDRGDHFEWKDVRYLTEWDYPRIHDVEVDNDGFVYVIDFNNGHILKFAPDLSQLLLVFGSEGYGSNQFYHPSFMHIRGNDVVVVEEWGDSSGIQYYGIKTGISEAKVMIDNFDATERGTNFYFKLDGQASIDVGIRDSLGHGVITLVKDSLMNYGAHYVEWNGRDTTGKVVLPGKYICDIYATSGSDVDDVHLVFRVKGTIKSGVLDVNEHWTEEGEPYVLVGDVQVPGGGRLTIDPGVKVMPVGNYGILPRYQYPYWHHIYAQGTFLNKILFTPHRKLYPVPDSVPKGFWKGIDFRKGYAGPDSLIFEHCIIEAAGSDSAAFQVYPAKYVSLTNCEIARSGGFGFYCDRGCDVVTVNNCRFIDNDSIPLIVPFKFIGEIYGNNFANNKPNVIGIQGETRRTDATIYNQGVPYWFLKSHTWECKIQGSSAFCPRLVIQPGVKIFFQDSCGLYAQSRSKIFAQGKPDSVIIFTALDTLRHWRGIHINNSHPADTSHFEYCEISYGGRYLTPPDEGRGNLALFENKGCFILKNSLISRSMSYGAGDAHLFETDTCISIVQDNTFYANDSFPLVISTTELGECKNNQFIDNRYNAILIRGGGDITKSLSIHNQGVPYVISGFNLTVNGKVGTEAILEIEKGNTFLFDRGGFNVARYGVLKAYGVRFSAYDTLWDGIKLTNTRIDTSILDSCIIEKALGESRKGIDVGNSWLRMSNSAVVNNECGIYVNGTSSRLTLTNTLISQNREGIKGFGTRADSLYIKYNEFIGNKCAFAPSGYTYPYFQADSNWWGDATGPWDPSSGAPDYNPSGRGDSIGDYVIYRPWLTAPVQPPKVVLLQPNGGEVLYSGQGYEIRWTMTGKTAGDAGSSLRDLQDRYARSIASFAGSEKCSGRVYSANLYAERALPLQSYSYKKEGILRQELYWTIDFPEGGGKAEAFWRFIDTVPVGESSYIWTVPNTPSGRCRVAVKIYYDPETGRQKDKETIQIPKSPKYLNYLKTDKAIEGNWGQLEANDKFQITNTNDRTNFNIQIPSTQIDTEKEVTQKTQKITDGIASPPKEMAARYDNEELDPPVSPFGKGGLKGDFSTFENGRIDNGSNGCMVAVDISDANFTIALTTDFDKSTAYNNGRKIVTTPTGNKVYFVYANEGITVPGGIYSCSSQDSGRTFGTPEMVSEGGFYPALGLCSVGNPCASWVSASTIGYTYWTSSWGPPDTIVLPVVNISPPSMVCDNKDTVHIVFVQYYELPSDTGDLIYMRFKRTDFSGAVIETLFTQTFCRTPSITIDDSRNLHILWQGERSVCYQEKDSTGWLGVDTIYQTITNEMLYPVIDLYGSKIMTVWQDRDLLGNLEIYSRQKTDTGWQDVKRVATTIGESKFPTLSGGHYCLWQDNSSGNWEVYKSEYVDTLGSWTSPENISNTTTASFFPHSAYSLVNSTSAKLYCLWTEGDTIPYAIKSKKLDVSPVAKVFADLGQAVQSQYCLRRDGYWIFGDKPYQTTDWGYENLRYRFAGLDPEKIYRLDLAYYFENQTIGGNSGQIKAIEGNLRQLEAKGESGVIKGYEGLSGDNGLEAPAPEVKNAGDAVSSLRDLQDRYACSITSFAGSENCSGAIHRSDGMLKQPMNQFQGRVQHDRYKNDVSIPEDEKGIGRIIQALIVDGVGLDTTFITPNHLKRISVWLPQNTYTEGEIVIDILKIKGKRVVCSELGLYEFPSERCYVQNLSGPQGRETQITSPFVSEQISPNPAHSTLKIRIFSPYEQKINITLFDVAGREVREVCNDKLAKGINEILFETKGLSAGVYFIRIEGDRKSIVDKLVIVK